MTFFGPDIRNGLPIGLGSGPGFGIQPFDPSYLFEGGVQGAWYDPTDFSTLFQDAAGTTPVTAVEQAVGLMLDKSKGLVLGSELLSTGAVQLQGTATAATYNTTTGVGSVTRVDALNQSYVFILVAPNSVLRIRFTATSGDVRIRDSGPGGVALAVVLNGQSIDQYIATASGLICFTAHVAGTSSFVLTSLKIVAGNHAYQSTGTSRPILRARYNLLTYSEEFDNAAWVKINAGATANAAVAPNGTTTADKLYPTVSAGRVYQDSFTSDPASTFSIYVKAAEMSIFCLRQPGNAGAPIVFLNASTGALSGTSSANATAIDVGNGWYRFTCAFTTTVTDISFSPADAAGSTASTPSGTNGILIWGAQLLTAADVTATGNAYQRVAAATSYDTSNAVWRPFLSFDGTDDSLLTNSIDFSGTDKMTVFAGVTKLSDAAEGILAELSANFNSNNGSFVQLPNSSGLGVANTYASRSRGTASSSITQVAVSAATPAPATNVFTTTHSISGDLSAIRLNGAASGTNGTGDQGTGNFGNYPLYIGRRNNASLPFNGRLTSLIVRGTQSTAAEISATEAWVNQRTGAF